MITLVSTIIGIGVTPTLIEQAYALLTPGDTARKAPIATTGDNVYIVWWTNKTGNDEVIFRASTDKGQTFGDKINLSNTTDADSTSVEIDSDANSVVVTW